LPVTFSALELVACLAMIFARIIFNTCMHPVSSKNPEFFPQPCHIMLCYTR